MPRSRVLSFMSQWGGGAPRSPTFDDPVKPQATPPSPIHPSTLRKPPPIDTSLSPSPAAKLDQLNKSPPGSPRAMSRARGDSRLVRPNSVMQTYNAPQVEVANDTPPELQPIFSFLNSHGNKLYQEGYFLKLHDLDSRGRPSPDRTWVECFAQLVGTVLSLWDAAALDMAGEDGEVVPTFINLSDAAIKMIESLPMNGAEGGSLQNVLSISTAANNRYLLHFNSLNSLTQWTAGIRLAMFEHCTLQEAYTGSLIAGKGKYLNNIKEIMERSKFAHEDWARVRFGAGTPWRRCWCVVSPPDEKEYQKVQKTLRKTSAYEKIRVPKGEIKFYDTRKVTKKTRPIVTISDAYAAYAIYPQSKPLIDQSTLVKMEGLVTIHTSPESTTEGFVFVMPEVHAAVTGFEMMLRWLFPVYDTFGLYGRPNRLIADTLDQRGLMFAMPRDRRYGYLDILDVSSLIHTKGSQNWTERQWRRELKKMTSDRIANQINDSPRNSFQTSQRRNTTSRMSLPPGRPGVRFGDGEYIHSSPGSRSASPVPVGGVKENSLPAQIRRTDSAPPGQNMSPHKRSVSENQGYRRYVTETPSRLSQEAGRPEDGDLPPAPPRHGGALGAAMRQDRVGRSHGPGSLQRIQSGAEVPTLDSAYDEVQTQAASPHLSPPQPVHSPPAFTHEPNSRPATQPYQATELRRAHSNVDIDTLYQMRDATRPDMPAQDLLDEPATWNAEVPLRSQHDTVAPTSSSSSLNPPRTLGAPADRFQDSVNIASQRDARHRLSTIPGSPFIPDNAIFAQQAANKSSVSQMSGVPEDRVAAGVASREAAPPVPMHSSATVRGITRKPLPPRPIQVQDTPTSRQTSSEVPSPISPSALEGFEGGFIDSKALERVLNHDPDYHPTMTSNASTEPDYASTASVSTKEKISIEKPRAGKLKVVGDPDLPSVDPRSSGVGRLDTWEDDQAAQSADIPSVDFGRTLAYIPTGRPGPVETLAAADKAERRRSRSADQLRSNSRDRLSGTFNGGFPTRTTSRENRMSYYGEQGSYNANGRNTPNGIGNTPGDRASVVWQPATTTNAGNMPNRSSVTPEEWVQQRALVASQPQYAPPRTTTPTFSHDRKSSAEHIQQRRKLVKTPPLGRALSGDWSSPTNPHQRTPPSRPLSRGTTVDFASSAAALTAREQMQVSRATGTPLLDVGLPRSAQEHGQGGLIGLMADREREKAAVRDGRSSAAVQYAIAERQQQQMRLDAEAQYRLQVQTAQQQDMAAQQQALLAQQRQLQAQQQQQMGWNKMALAQNVMYPQQRPAMQTSQSWSNGQQQGPAAQGYGYQGNAGQEYGGQFGQRMEGQGQGQQQRPMHQPYGASFLAQQQQLQQQQQGVQPQPYGQGRR